MSRTWEPSPHDGTPRAGVPIREPQLWIAVLLGIVYFHRELFLRETVFLRDLSSYFLPQKDVLISLLSQGEVPVWNPMIHGGQAFLPSLAGGVLFPTNLLYFVLPAVRALNWSIGLHMVLCLASTYWLARMLRLGRWPSLLAAATFAFSGPVLSLVNLLNHFLALSLLPLICGLWHLFLSRGEPRFLAAAALVGTAQVFAGSPEVNTMTLLFLLGWALCFPFPSGRRRLRAWIVLSLLILGGAAVQLAPTAEIVSNSARGHGLGPDQLTSWSLPLKRAPELVVPGLLGDVDVLDHGAFWGENLVDNDFPYLISVYLGCCTVLLAVSAFCLGLGNEPLRRRFRVFLIVWSAAVVVAAFGRNLPLLGDWLHQLPFAQAFRYPSKMLVAAAFPLALLAAHTVEVLFGRLGEARRLSPGPGAVALPLFVAVASAVCGLFLLSGSQSATAVARWFFNDSGSTAMIGGLGRSMLHTAAAASAIALLLVSRRLGARPWQMWLVVSVTTLDLLSGAARINPSAPDELMTREPAAVEIVDAEIDGGRLYRTEHTPGYVISAPTNHAAWKADWVRELLVGWTPASYGIPVTLSRDLMQLTPLPMAKLKALMEAQPWPARAQLLGAAGVSLVLTDEEPNSPRLVRLNEVENRSDRRFSLYRNTMPAPPVRFVEHWQAAASEEQVGAAMLRPDYDPQKTTVILGVGRPELPAAVRGSHTIQIQRQTPSATTYTVAAEHDGYLIFTEPFGPGWRTLVDGRPTDVKRADLAFVAVFLPAGKHVIERSYLPVTLLLGGLCTAVVMLLLVALVFGTFPRVTGILVGPRG